MATAAKAIQVSPIGAEPGPVPPPGMTELFAAMVVNVGGEGGQAAESEAGDAVVAEAVDPAEEAIDASVLLPMLDQQRAAAPAATLVTEPGAAPATLQVVTDVGGVAKTAEPATKSSAIQPRILEDPTARNIQPILSDGKATAKVTETAGERTKPADPVPVMRGLKDAQLAPASRDEAPVMRPIDADIPAPPRLADPTPVMRPVDAKRPSPSKAAEAAPMKQPIEAGRPAVARVLDPPAAIRSPEGKALVQPVRADPASVMRVLNGDKAAASIPAGPAQATPTTNSAPKASGPMQTGAPATATPPAQTRPAPMSATLPPVAASPSAAALEPTRSVPPQRAATRASIPETKAAAVEIPTVPVAANARAARVAVASAEIRVEPGRAAEAPMTTLSTEARVGTQPLPAMLPIGQPVTAPLTAPGQNVAAALSQQVLDMAAGDQWIEQVARDIGQAAGKDGAMRFRLAPETLGDLKIEITQSERGAHVRLTVATEQAQQALAAAEPKLAEAARAQGVRIAETEIGFAGGHGQGRETSRQAHEQTQAHPNQPGRAPRGANNSSFTDAGEPSRSRRNDRYA